MRPRLPTALRPWRRALGLRKVAPRVLPAVLGIAATGQVSDQVRGLLTLEAVGEPASSSGEIRLLVAGASSQAFADKLHELEVSGGNIAAPARLMGPISIPRPPVARICPHVLYDAEIQNAS